MNIDKAIADVRSKANGRTRYEGQEPRIDEVLVAEIDRLRGRLGNVIERCEIIADGSCFDTNQHKTAKHILEIAKGESDG